VDESEISAAQGSAQDSDTATQQGGSPSGQAPSEPPPVGPNPIREAACPNPFGELTRYELRGAQVQPDASYWHLGACPPLCVIPPDEAVGACPPDPQDQWWTFGANDLQAEIQELFDLASLRDDPTRVADSTPERQRLGLSPLLQYRPPAAGLLYDRLRPNPSSLQVQAELEPAPTANRVVTTGRELARMFECEVPGIVVRRALDALLLQTGGPPPYFVWSPPMQALVFAALDIAVYSAQLAAWHAKWYVPDLRFRPRPAESNPSVPVLYNRAVNETQSGDGPLRNAPTPSPGTPRHPSFPSGHSTTYAAAAEVVAFFLPDVRGELDLLADNAGIARLWAGVHHRSDHRYGAKLGRCVGRMVVAQLRAACLCPTDACPPPDVCGRAPTPDEVQQRAEEMDDCCQNSPSDNQATGGS
jgi:PAP2 superfamily